MGCEISSEDHQVCVTARLRKSGGDIGHIGHTGFDTGKAEAGCRQFVADEDGRPHISPPG
jgi:hypothetical protein